MEDVKKTIVEQTTYRKNTPIIRLGCFLTGMNCHILRQCSEASYKQLKRYMASLAIIMGLWSFIGYKFAQVYLKLDSSKALLFALVSMLLVWAIERTIILGRKSFGIGFVRFLLGLIMASIGAIIIDQIIFQDDIEKEKILQMQEEVNRVVPQKTVELRRQIAQLDSLINLKEQERIKLSQYLERHPTISMPTVHVVRDSTGKVIRREITTQRRENPKFAAYQRLEEEINRLRDEKKQKEEMLLGIRDMVERDLASKKGLLDDLHLQIQLLKKNNEAFVVWLLFFLLFMILELLVVLNKILEKETDYDRMVVFAEEINKKKLE